MKYAIVRYNFSSGQIRFRSKHNRWCIYLTSALLFDDSFSAFAYLKAFVHRSSTYRYEVCEVVSSDGDSL